MGIPFQGCISEEESGRWQPNPLPMQRESHSPWRGCSLPTHSWEHRAQAGAGLLSSGSYQCQSLSAWREWVLKEEHMSQCPWHWHVSSCEPGRQKDLQHTCMNINSQHTGKSWQETSLLQGAHNTKVLSAKIEEDGSALEAGGEPFCKVGSPVQHCANYPQQFIHVGKGAGRDQRIQTFLKMQPEQKRVLQGWQGGRKHCWLDAVMKEIEGQR